MTQEFVTLPREVMEQALKALENTSPLGFNMESDKKFYAAIVALRSALEQPQGEQEPDDYQYRMRRTKDENWGPWVSCAKKQFDRFTKDPVYTAWEPWMCETRALYARPHSQRKPLTGERIKAIYRSVWTAHDEANEVMAFARAIELSHGIK